MTSWIAKTRESTAEGVCFDLIYGISRVERVPAAEPALGIGGTSFALLTAKKIDLLFDYNQTYMRPSPFHFKEKLMYRTFLSLSFVALLGVALGCEPEGTTTTDDTTITTPPTATEPADPAMDPAMDAPADPAADPLADPAPPAGE